MPRERVPNRLSVNEQDSLIQNFFLLRRLIGSVGIGLPFLIALGVIVLDQMPTQPLIQASISAYYHTLMGDVFVGSLFAMGAFMLVNKAEGKPWAPTLFGQRREFLNENVLSTITGIAAFGVALFPTTPVIFDPKYDPRFGTVHLAFAAIFFGLSSLIAYFAFPENARTSKKLRSRRTWQDTRDSYYRNSGLAIIAAIVLMGVYGFARGQNPAIQAWEDGATFFKPVFWLETFVVVVFGIAWLVKGVDWRRRLLPQIPAIGAMIEGVSSQMKASKRKGR